MKVCINFIILLAITSCTTNEITLINNSGYNLKKIKIQVEKSKEIVLQLNYIEFKDKVSFKIYSSSINNGDGRFVISYNTSNSNKVNSKYFGYYTNGILDCENQTIIIKKNNLIEKCN
jgi:hypothetical protein